MANCGHPVPNSLLKPSAELIDLLFHLVCSFKLLSLYITNLILVIIYYIYVILNVFFLFAGMYLSILSLWLMGESNYVAQKVTFGDVNISNLDKATTYTQC